MVTEENKEAIRARLTSTLEELTAAFSKAEIEFTRHDIRGAIDRTRALLQELDVDAALGTATVKDYELCAAERQAKIDDARSAIEARAAHLALHERATIAAEMQATAFDRIATALEQAAKD